MEEREVLLKVDRLVKYFPISHGFVFKRHTVMFMLLMMYRLMFLPGKHSVWLVNPVVANPQPDARFCSCTDLHPGMFTLKGMTL